MKKSLVWVGVFVFACCMVQAQSNTHQGINDVLEQYVDKEAKLSYQIPAEEDMPALIVSTNMAYKLKRTIHNVDDPKQDIFAENYENIYPGAIVFADQYLANGDPTLVGLDYGTVTIKVDFLTGASSSRSGVKNSADAVQEAIHDMLQSAGNMPSVNLNHKKVYASNVTEMAMELGVNVSFLKVTANVKTSSKNNNSLVTEVEDYTQQYYTATITWEPDKSKYFGTSVTGEAVQEKINHAPLAIITSVTYGRRAYCFQDYSSSDFSFVGNDSLSAFGQSAISAQNIAKNSTAQRKWRWISGSDALSSALILQGSNIDTAIAQSLQSDIGINQGTPLYYTVRYLSSGKTARVMTTGKYSTVEYIPLERMVTCTFRNNAKHGLGAKLKMRIDYNVVKYERTGEEDDIEFVKVDLPVDSGAMEGYMRYIEHEIGFGSQKTFPLDLYKGEYLSGPIWLRILCRRGLWGKWYTDVEGFVYPNDSKIDIDISGRVCSGGKAAYIDEDSKTKLL